MSLIFLFVTHVGVFLNYVTVKMEGVKGLGNLLRVTDVSCRVYKSVFIFTSSDAFQYRLKPPVPFPTPLNTSVFLILRVFRCVAKNIEES